LVARQNTDAVSLDSRHEREHSALIADGHRDDPWLKTDGHHRVDCDGSNAGPGVNRNEANAGCKTGQHASVSTLWIRNGLGHGDLAEGGENLSRLRGPGGSC
jgi:hypothetical protein